MLRDAVSAMEPSSVSKLFSRSIHQHGLISNELPLRRYFALAGGTLLVLLLAAGAITPRPPMTESAPGPHLPRIRIYSELKGPEAVVIDTSRPIAAPAQTTRDDTGKTVARPRPQVAENTVELVPPSLKQTDAKEPSKLGAEPQPRSNVGKARIKRRPVSYARRPDVGPFDGAWTISQRDPRIRDSFAQLVPDQPRQRGARRDVAWSRTEQARRQQFGWFTGGW